MASTGDESKRSLSYSSRSGSMGTVGNNHSATKSVVGRGYFSSFLKRFPGAVEALPWLHTTTAHRFRDILHANVMSPQQCSVFDEPLTYFFYGKPSYRLPGDTPTALTQSAPVCLVMAPGIVTSGVRMYPFDTGACAQGLMDKFLMQCDRDDFRMDCSDLEPKRLVEAFFQTNANYFNGKATQTYVDPYEAESYSEMVLVRAAEATDDRVGTVELQVAAQTPFDSKHVLAVVIPDRVAAQEYVKVWAASHPNVPLHEFEYDASRGRRSEYHGKIRSIVSSILHRRGAL